MTLILGLAVLSQGCHRLTTYKTDDGHYITASKDGGRSMHHPDCPGCRRSRATRHQYEFHAPIAIRASEGLDGWRDYTRQLYQDEFGTTSGFENT